MVVVVHHGHCNCCGGSRSSPCPRPRSCKIALHLHLHLDLLDLMEETEMPKRTNLVVVHVAHF